METTDKKELSVRTTATQLKARLEAELPIMRGDYNKLVAMDDSTLLSLPMILHNLSVCVTERVFIFIEPMLDLYKESRPRKRGMFRMRKSDNERHMDERIKFLKELMEREDAMFDKQMEMAREDIRREKKQVKDKDAHIPTLSERIPFFTHVEFDLYEFLFPYVIMVTRGDLEYGEPQMNTLRTIRARALNILEEFIPKREKALETCNKILESDVQ